MDRKIETERLLLRPLAKSDSSDVFEWVSDPVVNKYMPYALYQNIRQVEEWIDSLADDENEFAFCLKDTHKVIGAGSVTFDPEREAYELGYNLTCQRKYCVREGFEKVRICIRSLWAIFAV